MSATPDRSADVDRLSERQIACLRLVARLRKTEQIAEELGISPSTVNTHIERAMTILRAPSRREAAAIVAEHDKASHPRPEKSPTELPRLPDHDPIAPTDLTTVAPEPPRRNRLDTLQRLGLALLALVLLCLAIAGLGAAIEQLSEWRSSLANARHQPAARVDPPASRRKNQ